MSLFNVTAMTNVLFIQRLWRKVILFMIKTNQDWKKSVLANNCSFKEGNDLRLSLKSSGSALFALCCYPCRFTILKSIPVSLVTEIDGTHSVPGCHVLFLNVAETQKEYVRCYRPVSGGVSRVVRLRQSYCWSTHHLEAASTHPCPSLGLLGVEDPDKHLPFFQVHFKSL